VSELLITLTYSPIKENNIGK